MKLIKKIPLAIAVFVLSACVDDFDEANPPLALDGPAGFLNAPSGDGIKATDTGDNTFLFLPREGTLLFSVAIVDAPGLIASANATLANNVQVDDLGTITGDVSEALGKEIGTVQWAYQAGNVPGDENITLSVEDAQAPPKVTQFVVDEPVRIIDTDCFSNTNLVGAYTTVTDGYDALANENFTGLEAVVELRINAGGVNHPGLYRLTDGSFGLYERQGSENNFINVEVCGNEILNANEEFTDSFSGTVNGDGTISITWSNVNGDSGNTVMTPAIDQ